MGNRLETQRRGAGSPVFRSNRKTINTAYNSCGDFKEKELLMGQVADLIKCSGGNSIVAKIMIENGKTAHIIAAEGIAVGDSVRLGKTKDFALGDILQVGSIPEGCPIFNIERVPGDGGKFIKSTGTYALVVVKEKKFANVKMPSGKIVKIPLECRATIGCAAGGEREEKPFVKAGNKFHAVKKKFRKYAKTRGVAKNAVSHPFGGEQHHAGKSKSTARGAPPGRKVGAIASSRTGRRKK